MHTAPYLPAVSDSEADGLFAALDQRVIGEGIARWTAFVLGIYNDGADRWIQVSTGPETATKILLRMSRRATAEHAAVALQSAQENACQPPVVDVMRLR